MLFVLTSATIICGYFLKIHRTAKVLQGWIWVARPKRWPWVVKKRLWVGTAAQVSPQFDDTPKQPHFTPRDTPNSHHLRDKISIIKAERGCLCPLVSLQYSRTMGKIWNQIKTRRKRVQWRPNDTILAFLIGRCRRWRMESLLVPTRHTRMQ